MKDQKDSEKKNASLEKKPGVNFIRFGINNFYAFFISSVINSVAIDYIGLPLSLVISGISILFLYIILNQITLRAAISKGSVSQIRESKLGIPIFEIEDELANALAVGFSKHFGYIMATTRLRKILTEAEFTEIMNHENNHIQQKHNLTLILPGILTSIVLLSMIEIAINNIFLIIFGYILIMGGGVILLFTLSRNIETLADVTSDSAGLKSALMKIEEYNRQLREPKSTSKKSQGVLLRTHPPTSERPKEPSKIKHILISGFYFSFLVIIGIVIRIILNSGLTGFVWGSIIFIFLGGILVGSAIFVFDYFLIIYVIKIISKRFGVNSFNSI
ncbi:MAG: M48 family metalloprotease, partial [Desulfonatronovibrio sp.]